MHTGNTGKVAKVEGCVHHRTAIVCYQLSCVCVCSGNYTRCTSPNGKQLRSRAGELQTLLDANATTMKILENVQFEGIEWEREREREEDCNSIEKTP